MYYFYPVLHKWYHAITRWNTCFYHDTFKIIPDQYYKSILGFLYNCVLFYCMTTLDLVNLVSH